MVLERRSFRYMLEGAGAGGAEKAEGAERGSGTVFAMISVVLACLFLERGVFVGRHW